MGVSVFFHHARALEGSAQKGRLRSLLAIHKWLSCRRTAPRSRKRWSLMDKSVLAIGALSLVSSLVLALPSPSAQQSRAEEYREKARFLAVFPKFVEWPEDAFPSPQALFSFASSEVIPSAPPWQNRRKECSFAGGEWRFAGSVTN